MLRNENDPNDFILASGHHTPTQKVSKWIKPPTLWDGLKTQSAGVDTRGARISGNQCTEEYAYVLGSHLPGTSALLPYLNKMKHEAITPRYQCQIISNSVMQQSLPVLYAQQWARPSRRLRRSKWACNATGEMNKIFTEKMTKKMLNAK